MTGKSRVIKTLIIGASGYIGSSLTKRLLKEGHTVTAVIGEFGAQYLEGARDRKLKICSSKKLKNKYAKFGKFDRVFNLSGYIDNRESYLEPLKYALNKPITTIKLIQECRTDKFINISTGSVYDFTYNPITEKSPLKPASPYAISQLSADYYTQVLSDYKKTPYLILRIFNPYGPPNTKRGIVSTIISELIRGKRLTLYNPERKFDFTYIDDITEAMIFCAKKCVGVVNIGCGRTVTLFELYKKIAHLLNKTHIKPQIVRSSKFTEEVFSDAKLIKKIGFKYKFNIEQGLRETVQFFKKVNCQNEDKPLRQ